MIQKNKLIRKAALLLVIAFASLSLLTGCGGRLKEMTVDEEALFVAFIAGVVANVDWSQVGTNEEASITDDTGNAGDTDNGVDAGQGGNGSDGANGSGTTDSGTGNQGPASHPIISFTDAINIANITATYKGYRVSDTFEQGQLFLGSQPGFLYLVVEVTLANQSSQPVECNIFNQRLDFRIVINGVEDSEALITALLNDLGTYTGTLGAGASEDMVLIFEVPEAAVQNIQSLALLVDSNGANAQINLQ